MCSLFPDSFESRSPFNRQERGRAEKVLAATALIDALSLSQAPAGAPVDAPAYHRSGMRRTRVFSTNLRWRHLALQPLPARVRKRLQMIWSKPASQPGRKAGQIRPV